MNRSDPRNALAVRFGASGILSPRQNSAAIAAHCHRISSPQDESHSFPFDTSHTAPRRKYHLVRNSAQVGEHTGQTKNRPNDAPAEVETLYRYPTPEEVYARSKGNGNTASSVDCDVSNINSRSNPRATPEQRVRPASIAASSIAAPGSCDAPPCRLLCNCSLSRLCNSSASVSS